MVSKIELFDHQIEARDKLKNGSILYGEVGSGKTLTGLAYYQKYESDKKLFVITTAKKRNTGDWEYEAGLLGITDLVVDSWNNIKNYTEVKNAFFIFDEQRVVGYGAWTKSFLKMSKFNRWILLTGTPGDTWSDYIPVMIANGFYRNKTDFIEQHIEYDRFVKYPKIKKYHNEGKLMRLRRMLLVTMPIKRTTVRHRHYLETDYDEDLYRQIVKTRWNPYTNEPAQHAGELSQIFRRIVATSDGRIHEAAWQLNHIRKVIVFYNYNYELEILRDLCEFVHKPFAEYNGHKHEDIPDTEEWAYLVQYTAGAEGWNCIETDHILFYSPNYSYKIIEQAEGRIDRLNTPYRDLNYTYLTSNSSIDNAVLKAITNKKAFNESVWEKRMFNARK